MTEMQDRVVARRAAKERAKRVHEAVTDELGRLNAAIHGGAVVILETAFGPYRVQSVNEDYWYATVPAERPNAGALDRRSFAGCNNDAFASLMKQAGEARHPLFATRLADRP